MVKRQVVESDISGEPDAATVTFGLEDEWYDIDLTQEEAERLKQAFGRALKPYLTKARRSEARAEAKRVVAETTPAERDAIRSWAQANGYEVATFGQIPNDVIAAYDSAHDIDRSYVPAGSQTQRNHIPKRTDEPRLIPVTSPEERRAIRAWAEAEGYDFATSGRIPHNIVADYDAKHGIRRSYSPEGDKIPRKTEPSAPAAKRVTPGIDPDERSKIRSWAAKKGITVSSFGRIPQDVVNQYDRAHRIKRDQ
ncbi:histone-like nucleoid-structuring protein Lsr2 [Amycolatopsis azurea]|uniref:Lsr2 dimerization domain-containing protein n=1 Tax=Amycolatopsis azurea TaxID=36819 RepID=UPI0037FF4E34